MRIHLLIYYITVFVIILFCFGCDTGYKKVDGKWSYIKWDEAHGRQVLPLQADAKTFEILENPEYAKDKSKAYYKGRVIPEANPSSYELLEGGHYAKDRDQVFLFYYQVVNADPETFAEIKFPYAKDKKSVYCGTVPVDVENVEEFEVIRSSSSYRVMDKAEFIKQNKEYSYLDTLQIEAVVFGEGSGKTNSEYFEGFKKVKKN